MTKIKQMCRTLTVKEKNKNGGHATCGPSSKSGGWASENKKIKYLNVKMK
jgi:hypothetical protein